MLKREDRHAKIFDEYDRFLRAEQSMAPATRRSYLNAARALMAVCRAHPGELYLPADWKLAHLDKRALEIYFNHLRQGRGWKSASIAQQASALRNFFAFLHRRGYVEANPVRSLKPRVPPRVETAPVGEEAAVRKLFEAPDPGLAGPEVAHQHVAGQNLAAARRLLLLELFYGGALRPSVVYRIKSLRVKARAAAITIATPERTWEQPLSAPGLERARRYLGLRKAATAGRRGAAFWVDARGLPCSPARLSREVGREMERVGLPPRPSLLRHLAARHFAERGGDTRSLRKLLGAKRLGSLDRYAPPDYQQVARQFRSVHPRQLERE